MDNLLELETLRFDLLLNEFISNSHAFTLRNCFSVPMQHSKTGQRFHSSQLELHADVNQSVIAIATPH